MTVSFKSPGDRPTADEWNELVALVKDWPIRLFEPGGDGPFWAKVMIPWYQCNTSIVAPLVPSDNDDGLPCFPEGAVFVKDVHARLGVRVGNSPRINPVSVGTHVLVHYDRSVKEGTFDNPCLGLFTPITFGDYAGDCCTYTGDYGCPDCSTIDLAVTISGASPCYLLNDTWILEKTPGQCFWWKYIYLDEICATDENKFQGAYIVVAQGSHDGDGAAMGYNLYIFVEALCLSSYISSIWAADENHCPVGLGQTVSGEVTFFPTYLQEFGCCAERFDFTIERA